MKEGDTMIVRGHKLVACKAIKDKYICSQCYFYDGNEVCSKYQDIKQCVKENGQDIVFKLAEDIEFDDFITADEARHIQELKLPSIKPILKHIDGFIRQSALKGDDMTDFAHGLLHIQVLKNKVIHFLTTKGYEVESHSISNIIKIKWR